MFLCWLRYIQQHAWYGSNWNGSGWKFPWNHPIIHVKEVFSYSNQRLLCVAWLENRKQNQWQQWSKSMEWCWTANSSCSEMPNECDKLSLRTLLVNLISPNTEHEYTQEALHWGLTARGLHGTAVYCVSTVDMLLSHPSLDADQVDPSHLCSQRLWYGMKMSLPLSRTEHAVSCHNPTPCSSCFDWPEQCESYSVGQTPCKERLKGLTAT